MGFDLVFFWGGGCCLEGFFVFTLLPDIVRKVEEEGVPTDLNKLTSYSQEV